MANTTIPMPAKRVLLWANPNPTSNMSNGTEINLSSSDYDDLEIEYKAGSTSPRALYGKYAKGTENIPLNYMAIDTDNTTNTFMAIRYLNRNSDVKYTAGNGLIARWNQQLGTNTSICIPVYIYGIKY